jgi:hypothetical protein
VITGYNTDVEHDGVVYHVQTEDKGAGMPLILSLVYMGGAILASKRSPYDDLVSAGFDEAVLAERLQRQHKLICAAIHAGRIEDLKRLSQIEAGDRPEVAKAPPPAAPVSPPAEAPPDVVVRPVIAEPISFERPKSKPETFVAETDGADDTLRVTLLDDQEFRSGQFVTVRVRLTRGAGAWERPIPNVRIVLKTLGSTFRPASTFASTGRDGVALIQLSLPAFKSGRAAVLVRAEVDEEIVELRRIILPQ